MVEINVDLEECYKIIDKIERSTKKHTIQLTLPLSGRVGEHFRSYIRLPLHSKKNSIKFFRVIREEIDEEVHHLLENPDYVKEYAKAIEIDKVTSEDFVRWTIEGQYMLWYKLDETELIQYTTTVRI
jgi:hypothetical protein